MSVTRDLWALDMADKLQAALVECRLRRREPRATTTLASGDNGRSYGDLYYSAWALLRGKDGTLLLEQTGGAAMQPCKSNGTGGTTGATTWHEVTPELARTWLEVHIRGSVERRAAINAAGVDHAPIMD